MVKKRKKDELKVSLFPFLSILACVLGILTLMITAVVLSQANNETFQEKVAEAMIDQTDFQEILEREKGELTRLRKELAEVKKQPGKSIDPNKKKELQQEIIRLKQTQEKKLQKLRQEIAATKKEKDKDAKELALVVANVGNVEGQLEIRNDPSKFAAMVVKPSGSGLGGSMEPTFVECDAKGINVFGPDGKKAFSVKREEIAKDKKWLNKVQQLAKGAPFRLWYEAKTNKKIEAQFIKREGGTIFLRPRGGKEYPLSAARLHRRSHTVIRQIEAARAAKLPDPVARYVIFLVRTKGIYSWTLARQVCRDRMCKNGKIPLDGEGEIDLSMFGHS